jgi:uncharacterized membrane protein YkoI
MFNPMERNHVMRNKSFSKLFAALAISMAIGAPALADDDEARDRAIAKAANLITPEQASEKALAAKPGTVTDIDLDRKWKNYYYEVEIVDANAIEWEVDIDATTGKVHKIKRDWFE